MTPGGAEAGVGVGIRMIGIDELALKDSFGGLCGVAHQQEEGVGTLRQQALLVAFAQSVPPD